MGHKIEKLDKGVLSGSYTWHGLKQYELIGARPVTTDEAHRVVDFPVETVPCFIMDRSTPAIFQPTGWNTVIRTDTEPFQVLAPSISPIYKATPHSVVFNSMTEFLLADFPLKICGTGTLESGRTWWIQMVADSYYVKGDESPNEVRLCYYQTYGKTSHRMFCSRVRVVCANTLGWAEGSAIARQIFRQRHINGAEQRINANLGLLAELHLKLESETRKLNYLATSALADSQVVTFLNEFIPDPENRKSKQSMNRVEKARAMVLNIYEGDQGMTGKAVRSKYALLNAFTDYIDHHSLTRNDTDRWMDSLDGDRAAVKDAAVDFLLAL